jgi:hypothetical protein
MLRVSYQIDLLPYIATTKPVRRMCEGWISQSKPSINTQYFPVINTALTYLMYCKILISDTALSVHGKSSMLISTVT